jgi:hypothetical protein
MRKVGDEASTMALGLEFIALGLLSSLGPPWEELDLGLGDSSAETFVESFDS